MLKRLVRQVETLAGRMARWHINMRSWQAFGTLAGGALAR